MTQEDKLNLLVEIESQLRPVVSRKELSWALGGLLVPRSIANLDSAGKGPSGKIKIGRTVGYTKKSVMEWLSVRLSATI